MNRTELINKLPNEARELFKIIEGAIIKMEVMEDQGQLTQAQRRAFFELIVDCIPYAMIKPERVEIPQNLPPFVAPQHLTENYRLAREFSEKGTVKNFALRLGFMPHDESAAEAIILRCLKERDWLEQQLTR